jgi:hypothetical protein
MAHYSPLGKAAVVAAELECAFGENPAASNGEKCLTNPGAGDTLSEGVSDNENLWTYNFESSTIIVSKIKKMKEKCYFLEAEAHTPGAEIVPEPNNDEAMVYEDFFVVGLCMPPYPAMADILLHFQT